MRYRVQFVHKPWHSPRDADIETAELPDGAFSDSRTLAKALREAKILCTGERLRGFRVEGEKTIAFPDRGIWHSLIITPEEG